MLDVALYAVNAVFPLLLLILLGYVLRHTNLINDEFLKIGNRFVFKVALPCSVFISVYRIQDVRTVQPQFLLVQLISILALAGLGWVLAQVFTTRRDRKAVIIQSCFRSNYAAVGLPLAALLAGDDGSMMAALAAIVVPGLFNVLAVVVLSAYGDKGRPSVGRLLLNVVKNPLVQAVLLGFVFVFARMAIPVGADGHPVVSLQYTLPFVYSAISRLGNTAVALALICMGGQISLGAIQGFKKELIACVAIRTFVAPVVGFGLLFALSAMMNYHPDSASFAVFVGLYCGPMAVATGTMCAEMGSDDRLAGQVIVFTCIGSFVSMLASIALLRGFGYL